MEAILNIRKSVMINYSYLKGFGLYVIMAAITAAVIMSIDEPASYTVSKDLMMSSRYMTVIEDCITEEEKLVAIIRNINLEEGSTTFEENTKLKIVEGVTENGQAESEEQTVPAAKTVCVTFYGNGGMPEVFTETFEADAFDLSSVNIPDGNGKIFNGWFEDAACTIPFTGIAEAKELVLYAGWIEIPGYLCNNQRYTYGTNGLDLQDGLAILPNNNECVGVNAGTFSGVENDIYEIYIPANITDIDTDAFETLPYLIYIEAEAGNPSYYSKDGILYYSNGNTAFVPRMRR